MQEKIRELASAYNGAHTLSEAKDRRSELYTELIRIMGPGGFLVEYSQQAFVAEGYPMIRAIATPQGIITPDYWEEV